MIVARYGIRTGDGLKRTLADNFNMRVILLAAAFTTVILMGCSAPSGGTGVKTAGGVKAAMGAHAQSRFISATITRRFDASGMATNDKLTITDPDQLAVLESYFPQAGTGERGPQSGGWAPAVTIELKPALGRKIRVMSNYEVWSEGMGDCPIRASFRDYIERLFASRSK
jgi:hypothetical protein